MGSYKNPENNRSGDDGSQDEGISENENQTRVDDFSDDESDDGTGRASTGGGGPVAGPGGSTGGGGGGGVVTEPVDGGEPEDADETEVEEEGNEGIERETPENDDPDTDLENDIDDSEETEEDADDDSEDEEEEDDTVLVVQEVDPLSAIAWGVQPAMKHVEECYGDQIELLYKPAPVRQFDDPEKAKQEWKDGLRKHEMPVEPSFWDTDPPETTELVNKAFAAAGKQGRAMDYLRALWRRGIAEGQELSDRDILVELASNLGLDPDRFEEDMEQVELESASERDQLPFTFMEIQGKPVVKSGRVRYSDFKTQFTFEGLDEQEPQELEGFVEEHGPVATAEVAEVYEYNDRSKAIRRLEQIEPVSSFEIGGEQFWET